MDCFKLQEETIRYLKNQEDNFSSILRILNNLTEIDEVIFSFYPLSPYYNWQVFSLGDKIPAKSQHLSTYNELFFKGDKDCGMIKAQQKLSQEKIGIDISRRNSFSTESNETNKQKIERENTQKYIKRHGQPSAERQLQINKQAKQKISVQDIFWINVSYKVKTKQEKYTCLLNAAYCYFRMCMSKNGLSPLVEKQFERFIKDAIGLSKSLHNIPLLIRITFQLYEISLNLNRNKDLAEVLRLCKELKSFFTQNISLEHRKEEQRKIQAIKQLRKQRYSSKLQIDDEIFSYPQSSSFQHEPQYIEISRMNKMHPFLSEDSNSATFFFFLNYPLAQSYYKIFLWRMESCIILLTEILHREPYSKKDILSYIKLGKWVKEKYLKEKENQINKENVSFCKDLKRKMWQSLIETYSNIVRYSEKLKQTKYFDMIVLELTINFKVFEKTKNRIKNKIQNKHSSLLQSNQQFMQPEAKNEQPSINNGKKPNMVHLNINNNIIKQKEYTNESSQRYSNRCMDINTIQQQLIQCEREKEKQMVKNYLFCDQQQVVERKFKNIEKENKRRQFFKKSLDYFTNRIQSSSHHLSLKENQKYRISLQKCKKDQKQDRHTVVSKTRSGNIDEYRVNLNEQSQKDSIINDDTFRSQTAGIGFQSTSLHSGIFKTSKKLGSQKHNGRQNIKISQSQQKKREGVLFESYSMRNKIQNLVMDTRKNIKPKKFLLEMKDAQNNIYRSILSAQQRVSILTNQKLEEEMAYIYKVLYEKATPTYDEIFISLANSDSKQRNKRNRDKEQSYSFKGIGLSLFNHQSLTPCNIDRSKSQQQIDLTMIQLFGHEVGFIKIKMKLRFEANENLNQISFTSYCHNFWEQKLTISQKEQSSKYDLQQICISLEQLRKQVNSSQFYFELIQENLEKNIEGEDIHNMSAYLLKKYTDQIKTRNNRSTKRGRQNQSSTSSRVEVDYDIQIARKQKQIKLTSILLVCINRMAFSLLYWYFTKASKINGNIMIRRQIPGISDSLKFAIALDFMKKYKHKQCLQKLSYVRNKKALYQCFRYLLYGRKILIKGLLRKRSGVVIYTLSLQKFSQKQFQIKNKDEGTSELKDINFTLSLYELTSDAPFSQSIYPLREILSTQDITLLILSNIIEQWVNPRYIKAICSFLESQESTNYYYSEADNFDKPNTINCYGYNLIEPSAQQKDSLTKMYNSCRQYGKNKQISNFVNCILWYCEIAGVGVDLSVVNKYEKIVRIEKCLYWVRQLWLGCGLILQIIRSIQNKAHHEQIAIFQKADYQLFRKQKQSSQRNSKAQKQLFEDSFTANGRLRKKNSGQTLNFSKPVSKKVNKNKSRQLTSIQTNFKDKEIQNQYYLKINEQPSPCQLPRYNNSVLPLLQKSPQYLIRRSAYHNRIVIKHPLHENYRIVNKIKKSAFQKYEIDSSTIIIKKMLRIDKKTFYLCISFHSTLKFYRIDIYDFYSCSRYGGYFTLSERKQIFQENEDDNVLKKKRNKKPNSVFYVQVHNKPQKNSNQIQDMSLTARLEEYCQEKKHQLIKNAVNGKKVKISQNWRYLKIMLEKGLLNTSIVKICTFQTFNTLSTFSNSPSAKLQLIEMNSKLILLVVQENCPQMLYTVVEDNPQMNNVNIFADYKVKEYPVNLYSDLFMRIHLKYIANGLNLKQIKDINKMHLLFE